MICCLFCSGILPVRVTKLKHRKIISQYTLLYNKSTTDLLQNCIRYITKLIAKQVSSGVASRTSRQVSVFLHPLPPGPSSSCWSCCRICSISRRAYTYTPHFCASCSCGDRPSTSRYHHRLDNEGI